MADPNRARKVERFSSTAAVNQTFTLARAATGNVVVSAGGVVQAAADYTVDRTTVRFTGITPESGTEVVVDYEYDL